MTIFLPFFNCYITEFFTMEIDNCTANVDNARKPLI